MNTPIYTYQVNLYDLRIWLSEGKYNKVKKVLKRIRYYVNKGDRAAVYTYAPNEAHYFEYTIDNYFEYVSVFNELIKKHRFSFKLKRSF